MDTEPRRWRWKRWLALLLLLVAGVVGWRAWSGHRNYAKVLALQTQLGDRTLPADERQRAFQEMRTAMGNLTEAQRRMLFGEQQKRQEAEMDRYFAMGKAEKTKYLDDRLAKMTSGSKGPPATAGPRPGGGPSNVNFKAPGGKSMNPDDIEARKKKMLDNTSPDFRAKMDRFRKELEQRAKDRGITLPTGRGR
jgi:hypothetical protein